jgi:hypothetical protein
MGAGDVLHFGEEFLLSPPSKKSSSSSESEAKNE